MRLDPRRCYEALRTRDERFDGRFFVGVTTTSIYCRPVCPARTARFEHCRFYLSAAAAQSEGFRPCLRCRPETAPDTGAWRGTSNTVTRGLGLIAEGFLDGDGEEVSVEALAERLGVGARHLRRLFQQHLGASPVAVAEARRVLFAKQLIHETSLPMADVAAASGFGSVRRFNEAFRSLYRHPPSALRHDHASAEPSSITHGAGVTLRLRYRSPYDWPSMLAFFSARAIDGVERVATDRYARTIVQGEHVGTLAVAHDAVHHAVIATVRFPLMRALPTIVARIRRVFDLGADVGSIGAHLARDRMLAPLIAERPGLRVPGGWDGFETAVRAVLGQQVSIAAARRKVERLAQICGSRLGLVDSGDPALRLGFPTADQVARADLSLLGVPEARKQTLRELALAALGDPGLFQAVPGSEGSPTSLRAIRGIGEWTAQYIALRAARDPDAFPASDLGLLRSIAARSGERLGPAELLARAQRWRPWRGYAAEHLWAAGATSQSRLHPRSCAHGEEARANV